MSEEKKITHWMYLIIESLMQLELMNGNTSEDKTKKPVLVSELLKLTASHRSRKSWLYRTFLLRFEYWLPSLRGRVLLELDNMDGVWLNVSAWETVSLTRRGWDRARRLTKDKPHFRLLAGYQDVSG